MNFIIKIKSKDNNNNNISNKLLIYKTIYNKEYKRIFKMKKIVYNQFKWFKIKIKRFHMQSLEIVTVHFVY